MQGFCNRRWVVDLGQLVRLGDGGIQQRAELVERLHLRQELDDVEGEWSTNDHRRSEVGAARHHKNPGGTGTFFPLNKMRKNFINDFV